MPDQKAIIVQEGVRRVRHEATAVEKSGKNALRAALKALKGTPAIELSEDAPTWAKALYGRQQAIIELLRSVVRGL